ncbi:HAD family hydrolase [Nocardia brasiliensis]|uniref:HAD family hydrolase n=1 Tax=Nocardia brasiliensis TaxID=37326 RepID=UPI0024542E3B|nr:HAD family hydrolase [Nocardia brasiliensis]
MAELLRESSCILLDFDGPICAVFAGVTDRAVSQELATFIDSSIPAAIAAARDPFEVLRYAASRNLVQASSIEHRFTELELNAVKSAKPTEHTPALIRDLHASGWTLAVVSNNSVAAINAYLSAHGLRSSIAGVYGRTPDNYTRLKPSPHLLHEATVQLHVIPENCVFVGDSLSDIEAGKAARIPVVALANKPEKADRFRPHSPDALITSMAEIRSALG